MSRPKRISRTTAIARGLLFYFTGKACKHGHVSRRYTSTRTCVVCLPVLVTQWRAENAAELAEIRSLSHSRHRCRALGLPDQLPKGYPRERLVRFFARVVALRKSGIRVECDHRIPLALGGKHTVSNLQILTPSQHRAKSIRDNARIAVARAAA